MAVLGSHGGRRGAFGATSTTFLTESLLSLARYDVMIAIDLRRTDTIAKIVGQLTDGLIVACKAQLVINWSLGSLEAAIR